MPYLGNVPAEAYTNTVKDSFNGDGSTIAFTLSQPSTTNNLRVVVENVIQDPTVAYSVSGTTLTFTSAPPSGTANIYAVHLGPAVQSIVPPTTIEQATTYTSALTVQGAFTSPGIDDNATSTAMTIDSSGDVTLSGGIYLGGTGAANKLSDVEEGTWTPVIGSGSGSTSNESGIYTKIGNTVTVSGVFALTGGDSTTRFTFPFAAKAYGSYTNKVKTYSGMPNIVFVVSSGTYDVEMQTIDGSSLGTVAGGARFTVTYITG